jgi:hypothetical protein
VTAEDRDVRRWIADDTASRRQPEGRVILARYRGTCAECSRAYAAGDAIRWRPGDARHVDCRRAAAALVGHIDALLDAVGGRRP